ncbi:MAG: FAD-dependent oxidoreductase [Gemmatimonadales bacterium]
MELDALTADGISEHTADVCIVGAGPAGLTVARALAESGRRIVLLESGSEEAGDPGGLNAGATEGAPLNLRGSRARAIGGTAALWNTIRGGLAGAKYVALDPIDFERRDELPWSGWPFTREALDPWYRDARVLLGFADADADALARGDADHPRLPFLPDGLDSSLYLWGPAVLFRRTIPDVLRRHERVMLIRNATVTELAGARETGITAARWTTLSGTGGSVRANCYIAAAGAIENARLMLESGVHGGAGDGWLGRGLMEHPIDHSLRLASRHPALSPDPGYYAPFGIGARAAAIGRIGCSDGMLRNGRLWNASLRIFPAPERRLTRIAKRVRRRIGGAPTTAYRALLDLEQAPHPDNRLVLSELRDRLGMRRTAVHWAWREADEANRRRMVTAMIQAFNDSRAGALQSRADEPVDPDVHHHAGTTRMHADPRYGVVDPDLRVYGLGNLYVVGASVFPTAGVANPMLTILALALRLADHLKRT